MSHICELFNLSLLRNSLCILSVFVVNCLDDILNLNAVLDSFSKHLFWNCGSDGLDNVFFFNFFSQHESFFDDWSDNCIEYCETLCLFIEGCSNLSRFSLCLHNDCCLDKFAIFNNFCSNWHCCVKFRRFFNNLLNSRLSCLTVLDGRKIISFGCFGSSVFINFNSSFNISSISSLLFNIFHNNLVSLLIFINIDSNLFISFVQDSQLILIKILISFDFTFNNFYIFANDGILCWSDISWNVNECLCFECLLLNYCGCYSWFVNLELFLDVFSIYVHNLECFCRFVIVYFCFNDVVSLINYKKCITDWIGLLDDLHCFRFLSTVFWFFSTEIFPNYDVSWIISLQSFDIVGVNNFTAIGSDWFSILQITDIFFNLRNINNLCFFILFVIKSNYSLIILSIVIDHDPSNVVFIDDLFSLSWVDCC